MITVSDLGLSFSGQNLFSHVNLLFTAGNCYGVIGANGAGKSTFLKILSGELEPTKGEVIIDPKLRMSVLKQDHHAYDAYTVFETILMGNPRLYEVLKQKDALYAKEDFSDADGDLAAELEAEFAELNGWEAETEAGKLLQGLGLDNMLLYSQMDSLPGNEKVKVLLAQSLFGHPDIILLDEPTSHLDVKYKLEFLSLLREMARKKELSVIMSLHELDLAERISDRVVCIKDGRMDRCGTPEQVFTPGYVEELFGMTAGKFDAAGGSVEFSVPGGAVKPEDLPENAVFVIAGNGSGRQVFRKLQRENVPFVTGILFENDLDLPAAEALAAHVVKVPLGPVPEEAVREARAWIRRCQRVICCRTGFGVWEKENEDLFKYAERSGKTAGES